jgi:TRAP-type C4-dicarboxylate transport system permease small subunit
VSLKYLIQRIFKYFYALTGFLAWMAFIGTGLLVVVITVDVCGRYFVNKPLPGSLEIVQMIILVMSGFAMMLTAAKGKHIKIDLIPSKLSERGRVISNSLGELLGFCTWTLLTIAVYLQAIRSIRYGELTETLEIPKGPLMLILAIALSLYTLTLLFNIFRPFVMKEAEQTEDQWDGGMSS